MLIINEIVIFGKTKKESGKRVATAIVQNIKNLYGLMRNRSATKKSKNMPKNDEIESTIPTKSGSDRLSSRMTGVTYDIMPSLSDTKNIIVEKRYIGKKLLCRVEARGIFI